VRDLEKRRVIAGLDKVALGVTEERRGSDPLSEPPNARWSRLNPESARARICVWLGSPRAKVLAHRPRPENIDGAS